MSSVFIPGTVETIGPKAFYKCQRLASAEIAGPAQVPKDAFFNCSRLKDLRVESRPSLRRSSA
jgi:hypothetical protein